MKNAPAATPTKASRAAVLKHPLVILLSIVAGVLLGILAKDVAKRLAAVQQVDFLNILRMLVPPNIFQALYQGLALQIVFFSIIFGVALGSIPSEASDLIINIMQSVLEAFQRLVAWSLYGLPFALVCL